MRKPNSDSSNVQAVGIGLVVMSGPLVVVQVSLV